MQFLYQTILNGLIFYFILSVFSGGIRVAGGNIFSNIVAGLIFGALMAGIPAMLKFFKLPVTTAATLLMSLVLTFIFYFLLYTGFAGLGAIAPTTITLGVGNAVISLPSTIQTMVAATVFTSLAVVGMQALSKRK